ncbi:type II secretion system protein N [Litoribrevibacter euphylliae]|uniref:Type II secretion system protein N n=1 Tax=Litoribrevibacter euphylliae TaxID=1834034 RepID=A0ABV7HAS0_9GAMM
MLTSVTPDKVMKLMNKAKVVLSLLFCVWLANIAAQAVWMIVSPEPLPIVKAATAISGNNESAASGKSLSIVSALLFGEAPKQQVAEAKEAVVDAPKTRLRLQLLGVFVADNEASSTAIVSQQGGKSDADFYRVGDTIQNGVKLEQVHADRVILNRNGRLEALYFDDEENLFEVASEAPKAAVKSDAKPKEKIDTVDQFASAAKKQWKKNPLSALGAVGFEPVNPDQAMGYRFSGQNPMMERYGIQKGDIIRSINGIDVGDVNSDGDYMDEVFQQGQASVLIERGSRQFEITVPLK